MIKLFEAFSGYGSQSLALKRYRIEFEHVGIAEIDKYAIAAHESLHGKVKNYGDISKLETYELPNMDLFTYSFPCQDISNAGKQAGLEKGSGTRSSLLWECERIIANKRPKFLMMENVKNLVGKKNKPNFDKWLLILESLGYNNYWKVINAKWCGVPQNRERVFCVSILKEFDNGQFKFEDDFDNGIRLKDILEMKVDEKYYLSNDAIKYMSRERNGKARWNYHINDYETEACCLTANMYKGIPYGVITTKEERRLLSKEKKLEPELEMVGMLDIKGNECIRRVYDSEGLSPSLTTMQGGNRQPKIIIDDTQGFDGVRVYKDICPTIRAQRSGLKTITNYRIRKLTPKECFRLMGLTDEEIDKIQSTIINKKPISNSQQYKLAGNSIVVNCMKFLKNINVLLENDCD